MEIIKYLGILVLVASYIIMQFVPHEENMGRNNENPFR